MGNPETKATLGYDIVQRQPNETKQTKHGKLKGVFKHARYISFWLRATYIKSALTVFTPSHLF
jgi:hypothetical protein